MRLSTTLACSLLFSACADKAQPTPDAAVALDLHVAGPVQLASAQTLTNCLAVDAGFVYWADAAAGAPAIMKVPLGGGAAVQLNAGGDKNGCVAVDGAGVYYVDGDKLMKAPLGGGGGVALATGQHVLAGAPIVASGGYLYWITDVYGNVDAYNGKNAIVRVATGTAGAVQLVSAEVVGSPGALAVDDSNVYYSDGSGAFARALAAPSMVTSFGQSSLHQNPLAVGAGHVAINELMAPGRGDLALFRPDGLGRVVLSPENGRPLAVDDRGVYVNRTGALERLALDGSGAQPLANQAPRALALSADHIYFTDGAAIYALAK